MMPPLLGGFGCFEIANCKMQISNRRWLRSFLSKQYCEASFRSQICILQFAISKHWSSLHHAVVTPGPASAEIEFLDAFRRGFGVVKGCDREDDAEFAEQFFEDHAAVREAGEFDAVCIDVQHDRFLGRDDNPSQVSHF